MNRYKAINRNDGSLRFFAELKPALELFNREYWTWRVQDTVTGAVWHAY